jgi:poly(ribitol-phosphate) beta-N-acetylglucosaminyltransferase
VSRRDVAPDVRAGPRVSVVVPVFDPGRHIEPCIESILAQTLPADQLEAIFVDDGSTDGTPALLDRLAAEHPDLIRVIHLPPSGSPGRPRNVGMTAARGDYIQFLDADDALAHDALKRLVAMADRNRSDIVVEKFASASISRSQRLFERNVDTCTFADTPGLADSSLGPAKLYRRSFLQNEAIAWPEGWRLMEDQHFALHAYLRARIISILADYPCYYYLRREDGQHLTSEAIDPQTHFVNLGRIFDLVDSETSPGVLRDRILRRLLRIEVLARMGEATYPDMSNGDRDRIFTAARTFLQERFGPRQVMGMDAISRVRCALLLEERRGEMLTVAERMRDLDGWSRLDSARWQDGSLELAGAAGLAFVDAQRPLLVTWHGRRASLDAAIADELLGRPIEVTAELRTLRVDVVLRERSTSLEWNVWARNGPLSRRSPVRTSVHARVDPLRVGAGMAALGSGTWAVLVRLSVLGVTRFAPLDAHAPLDVSRVVGPEISLGPALVGDPAMFIVPVVDATGMRLEVDPPAAIVAAAVSDRPVHVMRDGQRIVVLLPIAASSTTGSIAARLVVRAAEGDRVLNGTLRASFGSVVLDARVRGLTGLAAGPHPIVLDIERRGDHVEIPLGRGRVDGPSRLMLDGLPRLSTAARAARAAAWAATTVDDVGYRLRERSRWSMLALGRRLRNRGLI